MSFFVFVPLIIFFAISGLEQLKWLPLDTESNILERLKDYKPLVEEELDKQGLSQYTGLLLGMMYQESKGRGGDPMQSSESLGMKRNEIDDPKASIKQGVRHFTVMYQKGQKKGVDIETIIQSYNMGPVISTMSQNTAESTLRSWQRHFPKNKSKRTPTCTIAAGIQTISAILIATGITLTRKK